MINNLPDRHNNVQHRIMFTSRWVAHPFVDNSSLLPVIDVTCGLGCLGCFCSFGPGDTSASAKASNVERRKKLINIDHGHGIRMVNGRLRCDCGSYIFIVDCKLDTYKMYCNDYNKHEDSQNAYKKIFMELCKKELSLIPEKDRRRYKRNNNKEKKEREKRSIEANCHGFIMDEKQCG